MYILLITYVIDHSEFSVRINVLYSNIMNHDIKTSVCFTFFSIVIYDLLPTIVRNNRSQGTQKEVYTRIPITLDSIET